MAAQAAKPGQAQIGREQATGLRRDETCRSSGSGHRRVERKFDDQRWVTFIREIRWRVYPIRAWSKHAAVDDLNVGILETC